MWDHENEDGRRNRFGIPRPSGRQTSLQFCDGGVAVRLAKTRSCIAGIVTGSGQHERVETSGEIQEFRFGIPINPSHG